VSLEQHIEMRVLSPLIRIFYFLPCQVAALEDLGAEEGACPIAGGSCARAGEAATIGEGATGGEACGIQTS
jgi:hypothetical protein